MTNPSQEPQDTREIPEDGVSRATPLALAAAAFLLFVAGVYAFATHGRDYFDPLRGNIGELLAQQARQLDEAGFFEAALHGFERALETGFDDPRQRGWALRDFAGILLREDRTEAAIAPLAECLAAYPEDLRAHSMLCGALLKLERAEALREAAGAWRDAADAAGDDASAANARYHLGQAHELLGEMDEALRQYLAGHERAPSSVNAFHAARVLHAQNRHGEALRYLDIYLEHGTGWRARSAEALRGGIRAQHAS